MYIQFNFVEFSTFILPSKTESHFIHSNSNQYGKRDFDIDPTLLDGDDADTFG